MTELERFHDYFDRYADSKTNAIARDVWQQLSAAGASMPNAGMVTPNHLILTWDKGELHFELEILPDAPMEFFYWNCTTGATWEYDWSIGTPLPDEAVEYLRMVK